MSVGYLPVEREANHVFPEDNHVFRKEAAGSIPAASTFTRAPLCGALARWSTSAAHSWLVRRCSELRACSAPLRSSPARRESASSRRSVMQVSLITLALVAGRFPGTREAVHAHMHKAICLNDAHSRTRWNRADWHGRRRRGTAARSRRDVCASRSHAGNGSARVRTGHS